MINSKVLVDHFEDFLENMHYQRNQILQEWTLAKANLGNRLLNRQAQDLSVCSLFRRNNDRFKNLLMLIVIVLVTPVSSAVRERGLSCVKRIKSDWRSTH